MKYLLNDIQSLEKFEASQKGVFPLSDLRALLAPTHQQEFYRRISALEENHKLFRVKRGYYVSPNFNLEVLSQKLCPDSYLSCSNALLKHGLIATVPKNRALSIKVGKRREYEIGDKKVIHLGIEPRLYFGFEKVGGIKIATPEKAFLDTLYYHQKGRTYFFDIYSDIDMESLKRRRLEKYLEQYLNPKFKTFVRQVLDEDSLP